MTEQSVEVQDEAAEAELLSTQQVRELLANVSTKAKDEIRQRLSCDVLWRPMSGPQQMAYDCEADVLAFGGSAGSGKTDLAIGKSLMKHRRSAIMRREATQLVGIIDRLRETLGTSDGYNGQERVWRINPNRHVRAARQVQVEFGSTPHAGDEKKYQGRAKDGLVLDEATEFLESQVRFLMGWVRTVHTDVYTQTLMTFNPPTNVEGRWILQYLAPWLDPDHPNPALPGELRWYTTINGEDIEVDPNDTERLDALGSAIKPLSRTFIPGRITDNEFLLGTGYEAQLQAMPEPLRSQMLYGDFLAGMEDDAYQVIPTAWVDAAVKRWHAKSPKGEMMSMGVDVARGGRDSTVMINRHDGWWFDMPIEQSGSDTPTGNEVTGLVIGHRRDHAPIHLDVIGVGASPFDLLRNANQHVVGINAAAAAPADLLFGRLEMANFRSYMWWKVRDLLDPAKDQGVAIPPHKKLIADLCAPRFRMQGRKVYIESREELIKRIGRSPDHGTAFCQAALETPKVTAFDDDDHDDRSGLNPYR